MKQTISIYALLALFVVAESSTKPEIYLYEDGNQSGQRMIVTKPTDLAANGFNDKVTSVKVISGNWELYEHTDFSGKKMYVREGNIINVDRNDFYSSVRPSCEYVKDPMVAKLIMYDGSSLQGNSKTLYTDEGYFGADWNDVLTSVNVVKGDWELYEHVHFTGKRVVLKEGSQFNVNKSNFYSSARPICSSYKVKSKCAIKKIEIIDDGGFKPVFTGTKVIGSNAGASCHGPTTHELSLGHAESVEESMTMEISESSEFNWYASLSVAVEASSKCFGSGGSITVGLEAGVGGAYTTTITESKSFTTGSESVVGHATTYSTPGGAIVYGVVDQYELDRSETPVKLHLECPNEPDRVEDSFISLKTVTFQSARFWPLVGTFTPTECNDNPNRYLCVLDVQRSYSHFMGNKTDIGDAFDKCFE